MHRTIGCSRENDFDITAKTALLAGVMLSEANAEARRVEETVQYMMGENLYEVQVLAHAADILATWKDADGNRHMEMERVYHHRYDLGCIDEVNRISRAVVENRIPVTLAYELMLHRSRIPPDAYRQRLGILLLGPAFAMVFEGSMSDIMLTLGISAGYTLFWELHRRLQENELFHFLISSALISIFVSLISEYLPVHGDLIMISSIMPMVPGIGITTAFMDILNQDYMSGLAKLMEALMQALSIASGIGFGILLKGLSG